MKIKRDSKEYTPREAMQLVHDSTTWHEFPEEFLRDLEWFLGIDYEAMTSYDKVTGRWGRWEDNDNIYADYCFAADLQGIPEKGNTTMWTERANPTAYKNMAEEFGHEQGDDIDVSLFDDGRRQEWYYKMRPVTVGEWLDYAEAEVSKEMKHAGFIDNSDGADRFIDLICAEKNEEVREELLHTMYEYMVENYNSIEDEEKGLQVQFFFPADEEYESLEEFYQTKGIGA